MKNTFEIKQFDIKTLSWWNTKRNKIDMSPPYQRRGRLWSATDKGYLIDSIINGYDIPKIYIADFTLRNSKLNVRNLPYAIIDGKQRFEAIYNFYDGDVVLNDDFVYLENPKLKLGGLGYKDLVASYKEIAEIFENYNLMVMAVYAKEDKFINELFVRLNRSKPLTGAEIRNAMTGPVPELIRQIAKHEFFLTNIKFDVQRAQDLNAIAKVLAFEYYNDVYETKKSNLDAFAEETKKAKKNIELAGRHVIERLNDMTTIFLPKDSLLGSAGVIPVYYWFLKGIQVKDFSKVREFLNLFEKARAKNRQLVRGHHQSKDIKPIFTEYDNYNRSTNNAQSHKERVRILGLCFSYFCKHGSLANYK